MGRKLNNITLSIVMMLRTLHVRGVAYAPCIIALASVSHSHDWVHLFRAHRVAALPLSIRASLKALQRPHLPHPPKRKHPATVEGVVEGMAQDLVQSQLLKGTRWRSCPSLLLSAPF